MRTTNKFYLFIVQFLMVASILVAESAVTIPDPVDLSRVWWDVFQPEEKNQGNIEKLIEELKALNTQLEPSKHPLTIILIDQVILSAEQVIKKRSEQISYQPIHPFYLSSYSLSQWLEVVDKKRELENKQQILKKQQQTIEQNTTRLRSQLDYLQLEYPMKKDGSKEKLMTGLKIMNLRFKIELNELEIKQIRKVSNLMDDNIAKIASESNIAYTRLDFSDLNKEDILNSIKKSEELLIEANKQILESEIASDDKEPDSLDKLSASLNLSKVKTHLIFEEIKLLLYQLDQGGAKDEIENKLILLSNEVNQMSDSAEQINNEFSERPLSGSPKNSEIASSLAILRANILDSQLLISLLKDKVIKKETAPYQYLLIFFNWVTDIWHIVWASFLVKLFRINDYPVTIWVLIRACLIFITAIVLSRLIKKNLRRFQRLKANVGRANVYIISRIVSYVLIFIGFLAACFSIGIDMTNFVIIAGALGIGVGIGLQAIVNNFVCGLVVLFSKTLKVDDIIELESGLRGKVVSIRVQYTHLRTFDGKDIILPNADLVMKKVTNWTMVDPYVRLHIPFNVEYGADKQSIEKIVLDVAYQLPFTISDERICPKPKVWLRELGNSSLNMELIVWVNIKEKSSRGDLQTEYLWKIERELLKNGVNIPFPHTDIRLLQVPEISIKK